MTAHSSLNSDPIFDPHLPLHLADDLILRQATTADTEALVMFNSLIHRYRGEGDPDQGVAAHTRDLMSGRLPTLTAADFTIVEHAPTGQIVSSQCLISQVWAYGGIPFKVGRPEIVGTAPEYRRRGLVRAQFDVAHRWSAERGEMVQVVGGLPWYYRQFGYEMGLTLGGSRVGYGPNVPPLEAGKFEPYRIRPATSADLPFIAEVYDHAVQRQPISCVRDQILWQYELQGRSEHNLNRRELCVIETLVGEYIGYLAHNPGLSGARIWVGAYELKPGASWLSVTPSVLRYLWAIGETYAARDKTRCDSFGLGLGDEHPAYLLMPQYWPHRERPYAWYVRVPDLPAFMRHISPVLEQRLAASAVTGYTGQIRLNFYRSGMQLAFEKGHLAGAETWAPTPRDEGHAAFPDLTFLQLLFGYRTIDELEYAFADCGAWASDERAVLTAIFPKCPSDVWAIG